MPETEVFENYRPFLAQVDTWVNDRGGAHIYEMAPAHAISAYRKLLRWAETQNQATLTYEQVQHSPLAMALLNQAVGFEVVYADDLPPAPLDGVAHPLSDVTREAVYDALAELDAHTTARGGKPLHILTRTTIVHEALTKETT